ncbi:hypothetical protein ACFXP3_34080, partial [Streptomyces sp. NPDC059096]
MSTTRQPPPGDLGPESDRPGHAPVASDARVRTLVLAGASGVVPLARDFTRQALHDWGWLPAATAERRGAPGRGGGARAVVVRGPRAGARGRA